MTTEAISISGGARGLGQVVQGDLDKAQGLLQRTWPVGPGRKVKTSIGEIFTALVSVERDLPEDVRKGRPRQWTERRVRSIWHHEARRINSYEMDDLESAAAGEALNALTNSIERAARMAEFLATRGTNFSGAAIDRLREFFGAVDRA